MHLLQIQADGDFKLVYYAANPPKYAILSHTWGLDGKEVTFEDLEKKTGTKKTGYRKLEFCCNQAKKDGITHFWVDTCCINKSSSAELQEAINSMFRWYQDAETCYVYLSDVSTSDWKSTLRYSRWFTRGWTLQELLAPASVQFFSAEGDRLGDKISMIQDLHTITNIAVKALQGVPLDQFSIEERLSWNKTRETTRPEDMAYSLFGIFDICLPILYGEGKDNAFLRLRKKIGKYSKNKSPSQKSVNSKKEPNEVQATNLFTLILFALGLLQFDVTPSSDNIQLSPIKNINRNSMYLSQHIFFLTLLSGLRWAAQIPRSLSSLLPDNIILEDILGRRHSLQTEYFRDWSVLVKMLESRLSDCPGSNHVARGLFTIIDVEDFGRRIGANNWKHIAGKRKRFKMLINISETQLVNGACVRCGERIRKHGDSAGVCRSCGLFCKHYGGRSNRLNVRELRKAQNTQRRISGLAPPVDPRRMEFTYQYMVGLQAHCRLVVELDQLAIQSGFQESWSPKKKSSSSNSVPGVIYTGSRIPNVDEKSITDEGDVGNDEKIEELEEDYDVHEEKDENELPVSRCEDAWVRDLEQKELRHFSSIFIKKDSSLHDAAFNDDIPRIYCLLCSGHRVDDNWGRWGTPLIAAILFGSDEALHILLKAGADPLISAGPLGYPLNAAFYTGRLSSIAMILFESMERRYASHGRARHFQNAVDQALFTCMNENYTGSIIDILLYVGANPFKKFTGGRSVFAISLSKRDHRLTKLLLSEACSRGLLSSQETLCIGLAVKGNEITEDLGSNTWLMSCCSNIMMNRSKMLEDRVAERVNASKREFSQVEPKESVWGIYWKMWDCKEEWRLCEEEPTSSGLVGWLESSLFEPRH